MKIELPDFVTVIEKVIDIESNYKDKDKDNDNFKTIKVWMDEHRKEVNDNKKLLENQEVNKIIILKKILNDLLMRAIKGERSTLIYNSLVKYLVYDSNFNEIKYRLLLKDSKYRWITPGIEVIKNVVYHFEIVQKWNFKNYFQKAEDNYLTNFMDDEILKIKYIGYKVRDLALSEFSDFYIANDLHVVRVLTRTGLLNYGFEFLSEEKYEMGNNPSNPKNYLFLHKLILTLCEMTENKYKPGDIDRIFWHFGKTICNINPQCFNCPINNMCLTGKSRVLKYDL